MPWLLLGFVGAIKWLVSIQARQTTAAKQLQCLLSLCLLLPGLLPFDNISPRFILWYQIQHFYPDYAELQFPSLSFNFLYLSPFYLVTLSVSQSVRNNLGREGKRVSHISSGDSPHPWTGLFVVCFCHGLFYTCLVKTQSHLCPPHSTLQGERGEYMVNRVSRYFHVC